MVTPRFIQFCLVSLLLYSCLTTTAGAAQSAPPPSKVPAAVSVVPRPARLEVLKNLPGFPVTSSATPIVVFVPDDQRAEVRGLAERFAQWAGPVTGGARVPVRMGIGAAAPRGIVLTTMEAPTTLGNEGYTLTVRSAGVTIRARRPAGLFYGLQTLRQLFPASAESGVPVPKGFTLPAVSISDQPRFPVRSVMLDSARHLQSIGFLKKTIDQMAYHKLNRFHWHLTDDQGWRLEIKKYPKLTSVGAWRREAGDRRYGGFYTQDQVRDLVAYARERYVTIQPEVDMPAHIQSALAAYPDLACFPGPFIVSTAGVSANGVGSPEVLCVSKPNSFTFVTDVLTEVMALFPSKEIHIGGDECPKERWKACPSCQARIKEKGLKDETALQNEFTQRLTAFLESRGRKLQGWNEIEEGGPLAKTVVVHLWNDPTTLERSARAGHDIVYSYTRFLYLDQSPESLTLDRIYATEPLPDGASPAARKHLLGLEACLWTERRDGDATTDDYLWPRVASLSEAAWSPNTVRNWKDFRKRLTSAHIDRLARVSLGRAATSPQIAARRRHLYEGGQLAVGVDAGRWDPSMMSETVVTREWEITKLLNRAGQWSVQPQYTSGTHGIAVTEISLIRRGSASDAGDKETVVATDRHEAWIGTDVRNSRFRLPVPTHDPNSRYFLRLRLRSDGGTDSNGILTLYAPPE